MTRRHIGKSTHVTFSNWYTDLFEQSFLCLYREGKNYLRMYCIVDTLLNKHATFYGTKFFPTMSVCLPFHLHISLCHTVQVVVWGCITSEGRCLQSASATVPFLFRVLTATSDTAGTLPQSARYHQVNAHKYFFFLWLLSQMNAI